MIDIPGLAKLVDYKNSFFGKPNTEINNRLATASEERELYHAIIAKRAALTRKENPDLYVALQRFGSSHALFGDYCAALSELTTRQFEVLRNQFKQYPAVFQKYEQNSRAYQLCFNAQEEAYSNKMRHLKAFTISQNLLHDEARKVLDVMTKVVSSEEPTLLQYQLYNKLLLGIEIGLKQPDSVKNLDTLYRLIQEGQGKPLLRKYLASAIEAFVGVLCVAVAISMAPWLLSTIFSLIPIAVFSVLGAKYVHSGVVGLLSDIEMQTKKKSPEISVACLSFYNVAANAQKERAEQAASQSPAPAV